MADNIFDVERDRRIQNLQQQSVSNIIKQEPVKSQTQIEVEAEERRAKIKQEEKRLRQQDRFLQLEDYKQQRQFYANERTLQQRELQRQQDFISGQNRLIADQQIAQFNHAQENFRAGQRDLQRIQDRQLQQERLDLQRRQIDANVIQDRDKQETERKRIDADIEKYNIDARRLETQRDKDIEVAQRQLQDIQERVARDDALRHRQLQEQQELALKNLAAQQKDNERKHREELNKIQNQRAVDAERAITDRELIQGFTSAIETLNRQQQSQQLATNRQIGENIREILRTEEPSSSETTTETTTEAETPLSAIEQTGSEIEAEARQASVRAGLRPDPSQIIADIEQSLREVDEAGDLALSEASSNLSSSSSDILERATPEVQRAASIHLGRTPTPTSNLKLSPDPKQKRQYPRGTGGGHGRKRGGAGALRGKQQTTLAQPEPEPEPLTESGVIIERPLGLVESLSESSSEIPQTTTGGVLLQTAGETIGGFVGGIAQGISEQLPTAGQVGAAVGRGGVALATGVGSAIYEGLRGEPEPGQQTGGRLDPRGEVVGLGQEITPGTQPPRGIVSESIQRIEER